MATGRGVVYCIIEAAQKTQYGFGRKHDGGPFKGLEMSCYYSAKIIANVGCKVVAVSDVTGGIYNPKGLDLNDVTQWTAKNT